MRRERAELRQKIKTVVRQRHIALIAAMGVSRSAIYEVYNVYNPQIYNLKQSYARTYGYEDAGRMDYDHSVKAMDGMLGRR
jgi:hypothetical protein